MPFTVIAVMPQGYLKFLEPRIRYWRPVDDFGRGGSVIGRLPSAPEKFGTILKRNRVHLRSVRRGDKVARGITVEWKTCTS
jgi:hypothetical protein